MSTPRVTTTLLKPAQDPARVLVVGAGLGTGVQALWSLAAQQLPEDTVVVGYDLPGHGASEPHAEPFSMAELADAVVAAVALSHWPRLTRLLRLELEQLLASDFVAASRAFGRSPLHVAARNVLPHLLPQLAVGAVLMLPHAILHEAALTFLGFGLEPTRPAIGILLSEAMRTLSAGYWWLGLFPGLVLVATVLLVESIGTHLRRRLTPLPEAAR